MSQREGFAKDYVPVAERISEFYVKHPQGSLQSEILTLTDSLVLVKAWAYRDAEDQRPGIGHSSLAIPGSTPYTRGSEVENAETSAWGRAIAALGFEVKNGVATAEDVRNKSGGQSAPPRPAPRQVAPSTAPAPSGAQRPPSAPTGGMSVGDAIRALEGIDKRAISDKGKELFGQWSLKEMTPEQRAQVVAELTGVGGAAVPAVSPTTPPDDDPLWAGMAVVA